MTFRPVFLVVAVALAIAAAGCADEPSDPQVVPADSTGTAEPPSADEPTPTPLAEMTIVLEPVVTGFDQPLFVTGDGTGSGRLYVVEQVGRIWMVEDGRRADEPFLDFSARVRASGERGLLGLAFPEDFGETGMCIVSYTDLDGTSVLSYVTATDGVVDPASEVVLLQQPQPFANHNGGMIAFGPDGYLYMGFGDGGSGGDPQRNGQNPNTLLGKMLRLDVTGGGGGAYGIPGDNPFASGGGRQEIWAIGLRNPWRFSFDRKTGDLWIGDVGQNSWEEIDFQPASSVGGENYGWNLYEGTHRYPQGNAVSPKDTGGFAWPVVEYDRSAGQSVTGGYVYRGTDQEALWGTYFYADYVDGRIWGLQRAADGTVETRLLLDNDMRISSFGEDDDGEVYVVDSNSGVYRVVAQ